MFSFFKKYYKSIFLNKKMKLIDFLIFILLILAFSVSILFLWKNIPSETQSLEGYHANISGVFPERSSQFYPNLRFRTDTISYSIEKNCTQKRRSDAQRAFQRIQEKTNLKFIESNTADSQIKIVCSEIPPSANNKDHFVAGEGGPVDIVNATNFAVITESKVSLFRPDKCEQPQIATHEILHALGFNHNKNESSIMYPYTECNQVIDQYIIDDINKIYTQQAISDLAIENVQANLTGNRLSFEVVVANHGLDSVKNASLFILAEDTQTEFPLENFDIGSRRRLTVSNIKIPRRTVEVTFILQTKENEITKENNEVRLRTDK
jgi:predicted Zn-dependent protease